MAAASGRYAARTTVPTTQTAAEIDNLLRKHGASQFVQGWDEHRKLAVIEFVMKGLRIRFLLAMPDRSERRFTHQEQRTWVARGEAAASALYEQAIRQRWRALLLVLRAKIEAVESGIVTLEDEFLAQTVLPDGRTVGETVRGGILDAYATGETPQLLPGRGDQR